MSEQPAKTTFAEDVLIVVATICELEALKFAFGWQVSLAVAVTQLICILAFLYHAGVKASPDNVGVER